MQVNSYTGKTPDLRAGFQPCMITAFPNFLLPASSSKLLASCAVFFVNFETVCRSEWVSTKSLRSPKICRSDEWPQLWCFQILTLHASVHRWAIAAIKLRVLLKTSNVTAHFIIVPHDFTFFSCKIIWFQAFLWISSLSHYAKDAMLNDAVSYHTLKYKYYMVLH